MMALIAVKNRRFIEEFMGMVKIKEFTDDEKMHLYHHVEIMAPKKEPEGIEEKKLNSL